MADGASDSFACGHQINLNSSTSGGCVIIVGVSHASDPGSVA